MPSPPFLGMNQAPGSQRAASKREDPPRAAVSPPSSPTCSLHTSLQLCKLFPFMWPAEKTPGGNTRNKLGVPRGDDLLPLLTERPRVPGGGGGSVQPRVWRLEAQVLPRPQTQICHSLSFSGGQALERPPRFRHPSPLGDLEGRCSPASADREIRAAC